MKPAALRDATAANEQQKLCEKTLKHQAEVDVESHVKKEEGEKIKNQVQHSNIEQPIREVAETQIVRRLQRKENLQNGRRMRTWPVKNKQHA